MSLRLLTLGILATFACRAPSAYAYGSDFGGNVGSAHAISVGAGIASPAGTSAYAENPAGLVYNNGTTLLGALGSDNSSLSPLGVDGLGFFGNGSAGAALGVSTSNAFGSGGGNLTLLDYGVGATLGASDISFGVAGTYTLHGSGTPSNVTDTTPWGVNAGLLFETHQALRFGATIYDVFNGVAGFGAGVAYDASPDATLVLDGGSNKDLDGKVLKPGIQVRLLPVELAVSYGFTLDNSGSGPIPTGTTLGLGARITDGIHLIAYYNELSTYYAALTFRF